MKRHIINGVKKSCRLCKTCLPGIAILQVNCFLFDFNQVFQVAFKNHNKQLSPFIQTCLFTRILYLWRIPEKIDQTHSYGRCF